MLDHYSLFQNLGEVNLGKHTLFSPKQFIQKSKRKKFQSENEDKSARKEDFISYQRMFSVFDRQSSNEDFLLSAVLTLNKNCDGKDRHQPLQEVF